jgi:F0F1-type ATP synthase membrane subunit b/b'
MDSVDNIDRLVEIEHQAADIIHDAEEKASRSTLDAKTKAETLQNQKIAEVRKKLETDHTAFLDSLQKQSQKEISDYKNSLKTIPLNHAALAGTLKGFLNMEA